MNEQFDSPLFGSPVAGTEDSGEHAPRRGAMIRTSPLANHAGDLKALARRRLPRIVYDFLEGGSHDEISMRRNRADFDALFLRQRVFDHFAARKSQANMLGQRASMPVGLAPIGMSGVFYPRAEICVARAAAAFGVPYCLSTLATCSIEEVSAAAGGPFLFQLFMMKDRAINASLLERAAEAKCPGLVVNVDTAVQGRRNRDLDNGVTIPLNLRLWHLFDLVRRPRWVARYLGNKPTLANLAPYAPGDSKDLASVSDWAEPRFKGAVHTEDLEWLRQQWPGTLIVKGVLDPEDVKIALDLGADSVVVSNHGGRQLEGAPSTIEMVPRIRDAVGDDAELILDSGVRSGFDVLKALGRGANGCLVGRAYIYGLAAHGEQGVAAALHLLAQELDEAMTLTGTGNVNALPENLVFGPSSRG
ncbi:alpha-hydroxy acid oxidase [Methyloceanibacter sp.]|uniref:alpha-hydroxy acid oxidase n=1 Tax=Methyloceanibacter sp. TaxID=1965321 RepID=UPI002C964254|nr:alpha-hydroxy acid oxidase [Methyloceanibacter sp.]HML92728.1 alpha-hydroxy acid oxidase [Methyloceanibacter sp.]